MRLVNRLSQPAFLIPSICAFALACSDDGPSGTDEADTSESADSLDSDTDPSTDGTESSESADSVDTDTDPSTDETESNESDTDTTDTDTTDTDTETGDPDPACESEEPAGDWLFSLTNGTFPDDVPADVDESCTVLADPMDQLALDCPFGEFVLQPLLTPMPALPDPGATAQVRIHHEPGWQGWPDLWVSVDVVGGDSYSFQASSVLLPQQGDYEVPWDPTDTLAECGPFSLGDSCGEQVGKQLSFAVDGEEVSAWHSSYTTTTIAERELEVWVSVAREYVAPPEFCDFSPLWYSVVTRREGAG